MAAFILALGPFLISVVIKALAALGIGFITYTGFDYLLDYIRTELISLLSGMPEDVLALLLISKFDIYLNIILSAYAIKLTIKGVSSGLRKFNM